MKVHILVEDTRNSPEFEAEHGLSIYFEKDGKKFLFDLGQSDKYLKNAKKLNLNLKNVDFLAFSHGHYDHTGGLPYFHGGKVKALAHSYCLFPKFDGKRYIGFPKEIGNNLIELKDKPTKMSKNVYFLGQVPGKRHSALGEYIKEGVRHKDFLLDDTGIAIANGDNLIVLSGCAHSGIVNIVKQARSLFKQNKIVIIGGFHMLTHSEDETNRIIEELKKINVVKVYPGHCTGKKAIKKLLEAFEGERLFSGKVIEV